MAAPAQAQIGSGWTRVTLTQDYIDTQSMGKHERHPIATFTTSGARYDKTGDTETFELYDPSFNRVEHDTNYHYRTGRVQFEGTVQIYPGVNHQFIVQNFNAAGSGPILALSAYSTNDGRIVKQGGSVEVVTSAFGKDVQVNIIHDLDADTLAVYIDGKMAWSGGGGKGGGGFNFKYGSYGSLNGSTSAKSRWRNVRLWASGDAPTPPGPPDGGPTADGSAEARADTGAADLASAPDVAAIPDASATGGASGKDAAPPDRAAGTGGAGGAGEGETGGSAGGPQVKAAPGCSLAGTPGAGAGTGLGAALLWAWSVRRRRSSTGSRGTPGRASGRSCPRPARGTSGTPRRAGSSCPPS
jgi:hypothetical protein